MKTKVCILRGIVGAGKSYHIQQLTRDIRVKTWQVFSADDFWMQGGVYVFDPSRIGEAHAWCFGEFLARLHYEKQSGFEGDDHRDLLIVDNTNICAYEIAPYVQAANAYGLEHEVVTIWCDPALAAFRNIHDVPHQVVFNMYAHLLKERLPSFWKQRVIFPRS